MSNAPLTAAAFRSAGFKNKIHNGAMDVAQRGTSFVSPANGAYTLDRWSFNFIASSAATIAQAVDAPANSGLRNSLRATITTADASIAAGDLAILNQAIEGYDITDLVGTSFNLNFLVRSSKTGVHCVSLRSGGGDRSFVGEFTVNAANTWEKKTIAVPGGLTTAGTWDHGSGVGLNVAFALAAGTTHRTTPGAWQTGNLFATANQVNVLDTVGNIFAITGVQLELGLKDTRLEHRPYAAELALCQRYCYVAPIGDAYQRGWAGSANAAVANIDVYFPVTMRVAPPAPAATWSLTQANAPSSYGSSPRKAVWALSGTTASGVVSASNSNSLVFSADL